jgi:CHAT domain-containing protein
MLCAPAAVGAQTFYYHEMGVAQEQAQSGDFQGAADRMRALLAAFDAEGQTDKWMLADIYYVAAYMVAASGDTAGALALIDEALQDGDLVKNLPHMFELRGHLYQKITAYQAASAAYQSALAFMQMESWAQGFSALRVAQTRLQGAYAMMRGHGGMLEDRAMAEARAAIEVLNAFGQGGVQVDYYLPRMSEIAGDLYVARDAYARLAQRGDAAMTPSLQRNIALIDWQLGNYDAAGAIAQTALQGLENAGASAAEILLMRTIAALSPMMSGAAPMDDDVMQPLLTDAADLDKSDLSQMIWFLYWTEAMISLLLEIPDGGAEWVSQLDLSLFSYDNVLQDALATQIVTRIRLGAALALERQGETARAHELYTSVWLRNSQSHRIVAEAQAGRARTGDFEAWTLQNVALSGALSAREVIENVPARQGRAAQRQQARFAQLFELAFQSSYVQFQQDPPLRWVKADYGRVPEPMQDTFVFPWRANEEFWDTADGLVTGDILADAFEMLQLARQSEAGRAIAAMTARLASGSDDLALLLRQRDQLLQQRELVAQGAGQARLTQLDAQLDRIEAALDEQFPNYRQASAPAPLSLAEARDLLGPSEAMAVMLSRKDGLHTFLVTRDFVGWHRADVSRAQLGAGVQRLRLALDPSQATRAGVSLNKRAKAPVFDLHLAHELWRDTLGPLAAYLPAQATVFLVPDGPLQSLPFSMLLTASPDPAQPVDFTAQPWAIRAFSFATLPVPASLRALRRAKPVQAPSVPFLGVGDPVLGGHDPAATRGVLENAKALTGLAPLPETAAELRELNRLVAGGAGLLYLADQAREPVLKSGVLAQAQVLAFATHGLMGGELEGISEPALVLTPPTHGSVDEDGLLSASEIAQLSLNADWVLLSACNTAVGAGGGEAEGLSGLARAFFYAGARRMLVSHWAVQSAPTVALTTGMFRAKSEVGDDPTGARALRRSILQMIDNPGRPGWSNPAAWAPFVTVGG